MGELPKILIVEDDQDCADVYKDCLDGLAIVVLANNSEDADRLFAEHADIDGIMMDGEFPGERSSVELVIKWKRTFTGPFAAMSGNARVQEELLRSGCNLNIRKPPGLDKIKSFVQAAAAHRSQRTL